MVEVFKGTTTVGVLCDEGVVLASESRATMGNFIASSTARKIYQVDDLIGLTTAGSVGDAQSLVRMVQVEARLYKMQRGEGMTVKAITSMLANILSSRRYYPFMVQLIMGGMDRYGPRIYSLDALGGQIEERRIVSTGSGSPIAYGVLESQYREGISLEEGTELAARAIHNAMKRDSASGDRIELVRIRDKYEEVGEPEYSEIMKRL
ncbi:MAG TPA: archaeal proteasome endopeptidase complex subunit beta [Methanothrix sp.]|jgi:proteasome beta subunit|nr:archaeal proteasome endopeptidase complex subunit beta [Methanothrix sp.]HOV82879.1 archaeal proteasome endopeptidase complex subunit beta [Methanothrix sp.]HPC88798.1 archaeal proteasome endopeptidase complex subunit beta [Methanothrix sp.]HQE87062.1 archaeal proteasome endopeptidase complex subunit beta [Methanothrix sp.]HQI67446.1 archaeal proteasome endopeptidase complex subunit beta [Methanothrix sp.]